MPRTVASVLVLAAVTSAAGEDLTVRVLPERPLVEAAKGGRELNCDFLFENGTADAYTILEVRVSVLDARGRLATQRFVGQNGLPAGIETVPGRTVPAKGSLLVFNPLHTFDDALPLDRLRFEFDLETGDGDAARSRTLTLEVAPKLYRTRTTLRLPLKGRVLVHDGHDFYAHHRRLDLNHPLVREKLKITALSGRYAYDLCPVDTEGRLHPGDDKLVTSWVGWEAPVIAPAAGVVVMAVADMADNWNEAEKKREPNPQVSLDRPITSAGNHVVIDHGNGEFSLIAHFRKGSLKVKAGDRVRAGQVIGALGMSGDSFLPHVHYQLQAGPDLFGSEGLPSSFTGLRRVLGGNVVGWGSGAIDSGDIVEAP